MMEEHQTVGHNAVVRDKEDSNKEGGITERKKKTIPKKMVASSVRRSARVNTGDQPMTTKERIEMRAKAKALEAESIREICGKGKSVVVAVKSKTRALGSITIGLNMEEMRDEDIMGIVAGCGMRIIEGEGAEVSGEIRNKAGGKEPMEG